MAKNKLTSMVEGNIFKQILLFSLPIFFGNLFQLLYNTVDSIIVGQYVGANALAAVGASTPLINLLIGFFMGIASGAGVVVSRYFGAKKHEELELAVHTFMKFTIYCGIGLSIVGILISPLLLSLLDTPVDVFSDAQTYLQIYFMGCLFMMIYNSGSGVLRAVGDSKRPLYFLLASSVINVVLDLYFVIILKMGVAGVAWATFIAQLSSCLLVCIVLLKEKDVYRVCLSKLKIDKLMLKQIVRIGIPAGIQQAIVSFSNVLVQSHVNRFGYEAIAGFSSGNKFDNFLGLPVNSLALAISTFVGQNMGADKPERAERGVKISLMMMFVSVSIIGGFAYVNAESCISLFSDETLVIYYGAKMMRTVIPVYVILGVNQILSGALRGAGATSIPMYVNVFSFCIVRQLFLEICMPIYQDVQIVFYSYSITWVLSAVLIYAYYKKGKWRRV